MAEGTGNETAVVEAEKTDSGRIIFADDVVATIAALAAGGVAGSGPTGSDAMTIPPSMLRREDRRRAIFASQPLSFRLSHEPRPYQRSRQRWPSQ